VIFLVTPHCSQFGTLDAVGTRQITTNPEGVSIMATMVGTMEMGHGEAKTLSSGTVGACRVSVAKNLLLFFAAPFIGLAYIIAFPFVGTVALVRLAVRH
jgi:hypothetical protein